MRDLKKYKKISCQYNKLISNELRDKLNYIKNYFEKYTNKIYLVGGGVRDLLLDTPLKDIDIEIHDIDIDTFDTIMTNIGAKGYGKSFFVYKLGDIDISLPRIENKSGYGHRGFEVKIAKDELQASIRRDFTINAMMLNIYTFELLDFHNGLKDLENKKLKLINRDKFIEDSLRVLRGVQFCARFRLKIEKSTLETMYDIDISDLSKDRIYVELEKLFNAKYLEYGFYYLYKLRIFEKIFNKSISKDEFFDIYKTIKKYKNSFDKENYRYYFLYIIISKTSINIEDLQKSLNLPNEYIKILKKQPKYNIDISKKEILIFALKNKIKDCLLNFLPIVQEIANETNIYNTKLKTDINVQDIINDGYKGREISQELNKREIHYINTTFL
jgi:tRNA nucleotidyltransferase (CCA-adding enzyme)